jgi:hypothetical protein
MKYPYLAYEKEQLGSFFPIEAPNLEEAIRSASKTKPE